MSKKVANVKTVSEKNNDMEGNKMMKKLDMNKIKSNPVNTISSRDSLKDVTPIQWNEEVLNGKKKVTIK